MISAAEGAGEFANQTLAITKAAQNLQAKNLPITFENLTQELERMSTTNASSEMESLGQSADPAAQGMNSVAGAADDAAGSLDGAASSTENESAALSSASSAAPKAASGISSAANAARAATGPMTSAAGAASSLARALSSIPGRTNISITVTGASAAIAELNNVATAAARIPRNIVITITSNNQTGQQGQQYDQNPGGYQPDVLPPVSYYETYNIYDPLAAVMLVQQKRLSTAQRLEAPAEVKLGTALIIILGTVVVPQHWAGWFVVVFALLVLGIAFSRLSPIFLAPRLLMLSPFVLGAALVNVWAPTAQATWWSIIIRSSICLLTVILVSNTTAFSKILHVLRNIRVPSLLITTIALMHRYLFVLADEADRMRRARASRTFQRGRRFQWLTLATVLGQLFVRASERAERIYDAMCARGWK